MADVAAAVATPAGLLITLYRVHTHTCVCLTHVLGFHHTLQAWQEQHPALVSRASFYGGSFFDAATVPQGLCNQQGAVAGSSGGADAYVMRNVLHDFGEAGGWWHV